ncbi:MAG: hypothetical protein IK074_08670 [Bacteroidales bacterium]|nr:hypothetical protein [Bacteroidales bacterium]
MKAIYKYAIVILSGLFVLVACDKKGTEPEVDPEQKEVVQPVTKTLTFVLPANSVSGKTKWVAGDQIVVHGEYAAQQVTVTLEAGDIAGDGKTASKTVDNLYPYVRKDVTSTLYAGYPASAVNNLKHCFFYTQFNTTNEPVMAACNAADNDTFQFVDLSAAITFDLTGDYDSFTVSGNKKEELSYGVYQVKITPEEKDLAQYLNNASLTIESKFKSGKNTVYLPGNVNLAEGYTIKFKKGTLNTAILKTEEETEFSFGKALALGDVKNEVKPYDDPFDPSILDIDTEGNANCYVVTKAGSYKFKAVFGNEANNFILDAAEAGVLWETWNDASEVTAGSVLASASYAEDYIIFKTPATLRPGNAVIAVRDEEGTILWSWHIWVPKTAIQVNEYGGIMGEGVQVMDRNLGALVVAEAADATVDPLSYGLMYQWGRKDPFTNSHTALANEVATWAGEDEEVAEGQISLAEGISHPRLLGHMNDNNWMDKIDETLWSDDEKTIYDPCPVGYRVPARNSSVPFWSSDVSGQVGWSIDGTNGWLTVGNPAAVFPIAGYRDDYSVGGTYKVGARTLYWSARSCSAESSHKGYGADLRFDKKTYAGSGAAPKARLGSVRCVAE